jgi:hypothetical protein
MWCSNDWLVGVCGHLLRLSCIAIASKLLLTFFAIGIVDYRDATLEFHALCQLAQVVIGCLITSENYGGSLSLLLLHLNLLLQMLLQLVDGLDRVVNVKKVLYCTGSIGSLVLRIEDLETSLLLWLVMMMLLLYLWSLIAAQHGGARFWWLLLWNHGCWTLMARSMWLDGLPTIKVDSTRCSVDVIVVQVNICQILVLLMGVVWWLEWLQGGMLLIRLWDWAIHWRKLAIVYWLLAFDHLLAVQTNVCCMLLT